MDVIKKKSEDQAGEEDLPSRLRLQSRPSASWRLVCGGDVERRRRYREEKCVGMFVDGGWVGEVDEGGRSCW
jgi:hypothetical protein